MKNYSSILTIVNHRNWLDDSPPLSHFSSRLLNIFEIDSQLGIFFKVKLFLNFIMHELNIFTKTLVKKALALNAESRKWQVRS